MSGKGHLECNLLNATGLRDSQLLGMKQMEAVALRGRARKPEVGKIHLILWVLAAAIGKRNSSALLRPGGYCTCPGKQGGQGAGS
jgi:hypothetical protein